MRFLHCGDCCNRMSPLNGGKCQRVVQSGTFYFFGDYENRPTECFDHRFPSELCPVGKSVLKLKTVGDIMARVTEANEMISGRCWDNDD